MMLRVLLVLSLGGWLAEARAAEVAAAVTVSPGLMPVVKLVQAGVAEDVVFSYVQNSALPKPNADDIIQLHTAGVSDRVVLALLSKKATSGAPAAANNLNGNGSEPAKRVEAQTSAAPPQTTVYVQHPPAVYVQPAPAVSYAPSYYTYPYYSSYYSYPYYSYPYYRYGYTWPSVSLAFGFGHRFSPFVGHHFGGHHFAGHHGLHFHR
jgi:hypothetical protein